MESHMRTQLKEPKGWQQGLQRQHQQQQGGEEATFAPAALADAPDASAAPRAIAPMQQGSFRDLNGRPVLASGAPAYVDIAPSPAHVPSLTFISSQPAPDATTENAPRALAAKPALGVALPAQQQPPQPSAPGVAPPAQQQPQQAPVRKSVMPKYYYHPAYPMFPVYLHEDRQMRANQITGYINYVEACGFPTDDIKAAILLVDMNRADCVLKRFREVLEDQSKAEELKEQVRAALAKYGARVHETK